MRTTKGFPWSSSLGLRGSPFPSLTSLHPSAGSHGPEWTSLCWCAMPPPRGQRPGWAVDPLRPARPLPASPPPHPTTRPVETRTPPRKQVPTGTRMGTASCASAHSQVPWPRSLWAQGPCSIVGRRGQGRTEWGRLRRGGRTGPTGLAGPGHFLSLLSPCCLFLLRLSLKTTSLAAPGGTCPSLSPSLPGWPQ